jgi:hypothetical protein
MTLVQSVLPITIAAVLVRNGYPDRTAIPLSKARPALWRHHNTPMVEETPPRRSRGV